jgi:hypothetical protein
MSTVHSPWTSSSAATAAAAARCRAAGTALPGAQNTAYNGGNNYNEKDRKSD